MASESTDDQTAFALPPDLQEWLDEQAAAHDTDRETVLVRLLDAYRTALEGDGTDTLLAEERLASVESEFQEKIEDVRDRVIQVKKEADAKAPREHSHPELERVDDLAADVEDLGETVAGVREDLETSVAETDETVDDLEDRLSDAEDKLRRVAWAVSDLREDRADDRSTLDKLKATAASEDIERAQCRRCGKGVAIALLTRPKCPHCESTVVDIAPASGFFAKPELVPATGIESGGEEP
jgi:chromosome segregation ATPase